MSKSIIRSFYSISISQLLPYDGLIIPFTYFFYKHKDKPLDFKQQYLRDYFWRTTLNSGFSNSLETKAGQDEFYINHIANITIVDDFLNKRQIKDKAPDSCMKQFKKYNIDLDEAMKTHLIDDLTECGTWDNDYDTFFNKRLEAFNSELKKKIVVQDYDVL